MSEIRKFDWGAVTTTTSKPRQKKPQASAEPKLRYYPGRRARFGFIPGSEELSRRIHDALNALSKGVYWDRGSILNIHA